MTLEQEAAKALADFAEAIRQGVDMASAQAPAVAQEYIRLAIVMGAITLACGVGLLVVSARAWVMAVTEWKKDLCAQRDLPLLLSPLLGLFAGAIGLVLACQGASMVLKPLVAPRVFILETARGLMK